MRVFGKFGPLIGAIDEGTSNVKFLVIIIQYLITFVDILFFRCCILLWLVVSVCLM